MSLRTTLIPLNLKSGVLAGMVALSTVSGILVIATSNQKIREFLKEAFSPVGDFINKKIKPTFDLVIKGAKGIREGFKNIWTLYTTKKDAIHAWIKTNMNWGKVKEGWKTVYSTISDWSEKARVFIKDSLFEFIKEKILTLFKDWDSKRLKIFQFGKFFQETVIPTIKTLFKSEKDGKESRFSQFIKAITHEKAVENITAAVNLYSENTTAFGQMNAEEIGKVVDAFLDYPDVFADRANSLLGKTGLTKEQILAALDPKGISKAIEEAAGLFEKTLSTFIEPALGQKESKNTAKVAKQEVESWVKWLVREFAIPAITTKCSNSSDSSSCFNGEELTRGL